MRKLLLSLLITLWGTILLSQDLGISFSAGIASYQLEELRLFQQELLTRLPKEAKQFSDFPSYTNLEFSLLKKTSSSLVLGLVYAYSATGSHANYRDYSGNLNLDQRIGAYQFGLLASYPLLNKELKKSQLELAVNGNLRLAYLRNNVLSEINTAYYYESNEVLMTGISPTLLFGIQGMWQKGNISLGLEGGYLLDAGSELKFGDIANYQPSVSLLSNDAIQSDLSGLRANVKIIFWIEPTKPQE